MAEIIWSHPALAQLEELANYIALDKPAAARAVVRKVFATTSQLEHFQRLGRPIPEFRHRNYGQIWLPPCWIYYRLNEEKVYILHVRRAERPLRTDDFFESDDA